MIADGLNATDVLEYVATNMVDSIYLAVFDDVESPDIGAVLYRETLEAKQTPKTGIRRASATCQMSLTTPMSSDISGEPGPGLMTTASKCLSSGNRDLAGSASFLMM